MGIFWKLVEPSGRVIVSAESGLLKWGPDFERLLAVFYYEPEKAGAVSAFVQAIEVLSIFIDQHTVRVAVEAGYSLSVPSRQSR